MMYSDFFPPPREWTREKPTKGKGAGKDDKLKSKKNKDKKEKLKPDVEPELDGRDIMSRVRTDLFADDDEAEEQAVEERLSTHEKRQRALQDQIAAFEQENVGKKEWTLLGEVKSRDRPQNSMLEEDLEFEQTGKVVPIVTEEKVVGLEEMIKRRILDVSRRRRREGLRVAHLLINQLILPFIHSPRETLTTSSAEENSTTRLSSHPVTLNSKIRHLRNRSLRSTKTITRTLRATGRFRMRGTSS
jgi:hypothetical protein